MEDPEKKTFNMDALLANLPQKRGLSRYYSGKSRSFTCITDVQCVEDLKKEENPESAKKRKKYADRKDVNMPPFPCGRTSSTTQFPTPCVGA